MANYLNEQLSLMKKSFTELNLKFFLLVLFDVLLGAVISLSTLLWMYFIKIKGQAVASLPLGQLMQLGAQEMEKTLGTMQSFLFFLIASIVLLLVTFVLAWCLFKGLQWSIALKKKFSAKYYGKFLLLNLIWILIWSIPFSIAAKMKAKAYAVYAAAILLMYFTVILYVLFTKENKFKKILEAFSFGVKKFYFLVMPFSVTGVIIYILSLMRGFFLVLPRVFVVSLIIAAALLFLSWSKFYLVKAVELAEDK